jgi:ribulose-phosphate 3-epimerase
MKTIIAPSLLAADFLNLEKDLILINNTNAEWLHLDVMDGHFVPNLTFGFDLISRIKNVSNKYLDVHLMISNPFVYIDNYIKAGANMITFHYEAVKEEEIDEIINYVKKNNCHVGISIKPDTDLKAIDRWLSKIDMVLVMSVYPGFGGQKFIETTYERISYFNDLRLTNSYDYLIQVDGGVNEQNYQQLKNVGCNVLVAGSYLFDDSMNEKINKML